MINKRKIITLIVFLIICFIELSLVTCVNSDSLNAGVILADDQGEIIYSKNLEKQFIPASILKILTSLAAIGILGENYHFPTQYLFDNSSQDIYIKGFGDPLFISEIIEKLCNEIILKTHVKHINNIITDHTYFAEQIKIPGRGSSLNPYDASCGALSANFNTINFRWDSQKKKFVSGEPQTPMLSIFYKNIQDTGLNQGRIILSKQQSFLYPGLLIKYFLEQHHHIKVKGSIVFDNFNAKDKKIYSFQSPFKLTEIVQKLLKFSNNFIANQLLLVIGAKTFGEPATVEKGLKALNSFSKQNLNLKNITIHEGSGISRSNRISPAQMLKILLKFMPYHSLLKRSGNDFYKTGTLSDVRTRAGYILGGDKRLYPYVIMVNQEGRGYDFILSDLIDRVARYEL